MRPLNALLDNVVSQAVAASLTALAAVLIAYFRSEASVAIKWLFYPLVRLFPWHHTVQGHYASRRHEALRSELTVADVFLITTDGKTAFYRKTTDFIVPDEPLSFYYEGVTAEGRVAHFSTELGSIVQTEEEHGFSVCEIEFTSALEVGTRFRNVFRAKLINTFMATQEHWTQEIAFPTKRIILRIHFPVARPPTFVRCTQLLGLTAATLITGADIVKVFGKPSIVWEFDQPALGNIYKLEWRW
jgi:hypothetical protein